jgi:hypothetical protein
MRKFVLSLILASLFNVSAIQAQSIKEVDLFCPASFSEITKFPREIFVAMKKAAQIRKIGKIKAILWMTREGDCGFWIMTVDKKFRKVSYDRDLKEAVMFPDSLGYVMTKGNVDRFNECQDIKYFVRDSDHRIPNHISNSQNTLYDPDWPK